MKTQNLIEKSKLLFTILMVVLISIISNSYSQVTEEWLSIYNGPGNSTDACTSITNYGNYIYVCGYSYGDSSELDICTIKYSLSGVQQWVKRYDGAYNANDKAYAVTADKSGNIYITGYISHSTTSPYYRDIVLLKYDSSGVQQWVKTYNGPTNANDIGSSVITDNSGNIYVSGYIGDSETSGTDIILIKYNSFGDLLWSRTYNGSGNQDDDILGITIDKLNNVIITGYANISGYLHLMDYITIKYDSSGVMQWTNLYNGPDYYQDFATDVITDSNNNVYVTGASHQTTNAYYDFVTIKYNSSGVQQWVQVFDNSIHRDDIASKILLDANYNIYVTGNCWNPNNGDIGIVKYKSSGAQEWAVIYNGVGNNEDRVNAMSLDNSGYIYLAGESKTYSGSYNDLFLIKYNPSGDTQWSKSYNGSANLGDAASGIFVDNLCNVYVTGQVRNTGTSYDFITIKYSELTGIHQSSAEIPELFLLYQNYPNPFNPSTKIKFGIPSNVIGEMSNVEIVIYDVIGKEISTIVNEQLNPGTYEIEWNASNSPSGVYFYQLITDGNIIGTKRMVLLK
ncbi:MAG: T9SS C-terminal target domain-containing protein [Ignavibacteriae bacterium]|nr:MAG: T9SS C-terminal target domain-containing protein [Ignavibacteriota bacterium]